MIDANAISGLCQKAIDMRSESYAPYSNFLVGSALLTSDGKVFTGCNVENSAFGPSICAGGKRDGDLQYCAPCGVCRQVMREFCRPDFKIYLAKSAGDYQEYTLAELLPESFGPENLD